MASIAEPLLGDARRSDAQSPQGPMRLGSGLSSKSGASASSAKFKAVVKKVQLGNRFIESVQQEVDLHRYHSKMFTPKEVQTSLRSLASVVGLAGKDEEEVADAPERQTNTEAVINLLNNCLGSGMLGVAFSIKKAGVFPSIFLMCGSMLLNRSTLLLNFKTCLASGADPATADLGEKAFGKAGKMFMVLLFTLLGFFCMVSYVDASADAVGGILAHFGRDVDRTVLLVVCWLVLLVPPTFMRSMKMIALLSLIAFLGGCVMLVCVMLYCGTQIAQAGFPAMEDVDWMPPSIGSFFQALPIFLLIFSIQAGGGVVLATLEDSREENVTKVTNRAFAIALVMDFLMGFSCYFVFLRETKGDVLNNMPSDSPLAIVSRFALVDLVVLSYMIMAIPCKVSMIDLLFGKNEAKNEASAVEFYGFNIALNVAALLFALAASDLALILSINGALVTNLVAFILPAACYLKLSTDLAWRQKLAGVLLGLFGIFSLVLCSSMI